MDLDRPRYVERSAFGDLRPRGVEAGCFEGLWVAGSLAGLAGKTVAVVGSRAPTDAGRTRARDLGAALARAGVCVISGLALGIDGAAHAGALAGGGVTIGVLGGGHRCFFPRRNRALAEEMIARGGAVISPYEPDAPALPHQFLQRNGVVALLADAAVIVEAAQRSGALNTAGWASTLGIPVMAYPGDVDRAKSAGCNALIRDGATLVRGPADILEGLTLCSEAATAAQTERADPLERAIVARLRSGAADFVALASATSATTPDLIAALVRLEMDDAIERQDVFSYALRPPSVVAPTERVRARQA